MAQVTSESEPASPVGKVMAQFTNAVEHIHTATLSIVSVCLLTTLGRGQEGMGAGNNYNRALSPHGGELGFRFVYPKVYLGVVS